MFHYTLCLTFLTVFGWTGRAKQELEGKETGATVDADVADCMKELYVYMNFSNWKIDDNYAAMFLSNTWGVKGMGNYEQCTMHGGSFCIDISGQQASCGSVVKEGNGCCIPAPCEGSAIEKEIAALFCTPLQGILAMQKELELLNITIEGVPIDRVIDMLPDLSIFNFGNRTISCGKYSKPLTAGSICCICFLILLFSIVLLASLPRYLRTMYCPDEKKKMTLNTAAESINATRQGDTWEDFRSVGGETKNRNTVQSTGGCGMIEDVIIAEQEGPFAKLKDNKILNTFNFQANWESLITFVPRNTSFLDGIRFWSFAWVVLGHTAVCESLMGFDNYESILTHYAPKELWFIVFEAQGVLSVDTFFWLGSFLTGYVLPKKLIKMRVKFCDFWWFIPVFVVRRWLRIMPACLFVLVCFWQLFPLMSWGPQSLGNILEASAEECADVWWKYALWIGTLQKSTNYYSWACQGWYWYLQSEMYMYYIAIIILSFYIVNRYVAIGMSVICTLLFTIIAWNQAWVSHESWNGVFYYHVWPSKVIPAENEMYYFRFWNRAGVYFLGLTAGLIFRELDARKHKISRCLSTWLQLFSCILLFLICSIFFTDIRGPPKGHKFTEVLGLAGWTNMGEAAYLGLARPSWGFGLSVLAYSFIYTEGEKGFFNRMLSLPIYSPLGKLTFVGYLIHLDWIQLYAATAAGLWEHYTPISQLRDFLGFLCITLLSAFTIHMIFELPFAKLERLIFEGKGSQGKTVEDPIKILNKAERYKSPLLYNH